MSPSLLRGGFFCPYIYIMCYNLAAHAYKMLNYAKRIGATKDEIAYLEEKWKELEGIRVYHQVSGFDHPELLHFYLNENKQLDCGLASWGLIPDWTTNLDHAIELRNKTIVARGESIFEKKSFQKSAESSRCIVCIDGFYEHHHVKTKRIPYYIYHKDKRPLALAGLKSQWTDKESGDVFNTIAIVTAVGNKRMAEIHNNPKIAGPRMPLILNENEVKQWLNSEDRREVEALVKPFDGDLADQTVGAILGKHTVGNSEKAKEERPYQELNEQGSLF